MYIKIDGIHEQVLLGLAKRNGEKTGAGMARLLIRDAGRAQGLWPKNGHAETADTHPAPGTEHSPAVPA